MQFWQLTQKQRKILQSTHNNVTEENVRPKKEKYMSHQLYCIFKQW